LWKGKSLCLYYNLFPWNGDTNMWAVISRNLKHQQKKAFKTKISCDLKIYSTLYLVAMQLETVHCIQKILTFGSHFVFTFDILSSVFLWYHKKFSSKQLINDFKNIWNYNVINRYILKVLQFLEYISQLSR
jgi:hypothetical protein